MLYAIYAICYIFLGIHKVLKEDGRSQFKRLPYISDDGEGYYLDLLVLRANARLRKISFFYMFLRAIYQHTTDPLIDYDPTIPLREDEEIQGEEVDVVEEEEEELYGEEDDWFVYPHDITYEDDQDDADFVV